MTFLIALNFLAILNLLLFSFILFIKKPVLRANKYLSIVMLFPIFALLLNLLTNLRLEKEYEWLFFISYLCNFVWAPMYLLYVHEMLQIRIKLRQKHLLYFFPLCIVLCQLVWFSLQPDSVRYNQYALIHQNHYPLQFIVMDLLLLLQVVAAQLYAYHLVKKRVAEIMEVFSDFKSISISWLKEFIYVYSALALISFLPVLLDLPLSYFLVFAPLGSIATYAYLLYKNMHTPDVFTPAVLDLLNQTQEEFDSNLDLHTTVSIQSVDTALIEKVQFVLKNDKLYLNSDLNILQLATACTTSIHVLSKLINDHFEKNFFDFINTYRVEEAKVKLLDTYSELYTIEGIAREVGFNSRSAFYTAFKKCTGLTPTEFKSNHKQYFN